MIVLRDKKEAKPVAKFLDAMEIFTEGLIVLGNQDFDILQF